MARSATTASQRQSLRDIFDVEIVVAGEPVTSESTLSSMLLGVGGERDVEFIDPSNVRVVQVIVGCSNGVSVQKATKVKLGTPGSELQSQSRYLSHNYNLRCLLGFLGVQS